MHVEQNSDNSIIGTIVTFVLALISISDVKVAVQIGAGLATIVAGLTTAYYTYKNNRKK